MSTIWTHELADRVKARHLPPNILNRFRKKEAGNLTMLSTCFIVSIAVVAIMNFGMRHFGLEQHLAIRIIVFVLGFFIVAGVAVYLWVTARQAAWASGDEISCERPHIAEIFREHILVFYTRHQRNATFSFYFLGRFAPNPSALVSKAKIVYMVRDGADIDSPAEILAVAVDGEILDPNEFV